MSAHTEGPWRWFGNTDTKTLYLASVHNGRQIVMDFRRYGTQGAKLRFPVDGRMVGAEEMVKYEVCLDAENRDDERVYRADVADIDHPDARILKASVDLYEAGASVLGLWRRLDDPDLSAEEADEVSDALEFAFGALEQAVAEAEGRS